MLSLLYSHIPNILSYSRIFFTILALGFYSFLFPKIFLFCLLIAFLTDFLDGYLARKLKLSSKFGSILDPACDKVFIVLMISFFYIEGALSKFYCVMLMMRSFVQIFSFLLVAYLGFKFSAKPSVLAKKLNFLFFVFIFFLAYVLGFHESYFLEDSFFYRMSLLVLSLGEVFFMIYYPIEFFKILKEEKSFFG